VIGTLLKCQKCGLIWEYKGHRAYATCPNCLSKVKAQESKEGTKNVYQVKKLAQDLIETAKMRGYSFSISEDDLIKLLRKKS
jgi:DNA-directed RNA polymerase subunit RPC12/RpoP